MDFCAESVGQALVLLFQFKRFYTLNSLLHCRLRKDWLTVKDTLSNEKLRSNSNTEVIGSLEKQLGRQTVICDLGEL